jgi:hypothetical protein
LHREIIVVALDASEYVLHDSGVNVMISKTFSHKKIGDKIGGFESNYLQLFWKKKTSKTFFFFFFFKEVARGGERTRVLSISFIFSFSPLYRGATAAPKKHQNIVFKEKRPFFRWKYLKLAKVVKNTDHNIDP